MLNTQDWVDVSHGIGVPFGALGTGYGVLGKYGFVLPNFDSFPCQGKYAGFNTIEKYDYLELHGQDKKNFMQLILSVNGKEYVFQKELHEGMSGNAADAFSSRELLPFSLHTAEYEEIGITMEMFTYTPMIPHELAESAVPALCMDISVWNHTDKAIECKLQFRFHGEYTGAPQVRALFENQKDFCCLVLPAKGKICTRGFFTWFYPDFVTPSPMLTDAFKRYYTLRFKNAEEVFFYALEHADIWKEKIQKWQSSLNVPAPFKRMWFSSLSSVITSTMISTEPRFFEIEAPHPWVNTMDVTIYSSWIYMINWPEIEKMDMYQYREKIPKTGEQKGLVWHSLWNDQTDYVEEPCFITRIYRDYLWYNDKKFLQDMSESVKNAFERVYRQGGYHGLIESQHGNQSYDVWKMPGISAYVNMPWLYALYSISKMNNLLDNEICYGDTNVEDILEEAIDNFVKYLWNEEKEYFNCFYRTENAKNLSIPESVFMDQMFGRWLLLIKKDLDALLPLEMIKKSMKYVYKNNLIEDEEHRFRGWSNGKLPDNVPCCDNRQYHVKTCWLGAQLNLASILGELGYEEESLDVFYSIEKSLHNNHLAVGEWNMSITPEGKCCPLPEEISKDTPRFPAYPRYKSSWEYLIRILGLKLDEKSMELRPFKRFDFSISDIYLAGCKLSVEVHKDWKEIYVDGIKRKDAIFERKGTHVIRFSGGKENA